MNAKQSYQVILVLSPAIATLVFAGLLLSLNAGPLSYLVFAVGVTQQPDVNATHTYQAHTMILGNNVKNLVITIPNEAHEPPGLLPRDLRVANQPYFPQNAVVNVGTTVIWFNGDVGHFHKITLANNKNLRNMLFDSGLFNNFAGSKPIRFNDTGTFAYSGPSFNKGSPNYKMNGTLTVINQASPVSGTNNTAARIDTIVPFMVPANLQDKLVSQFKTQGFGVDSTYTFKSIRGDGLEGCGDKNEALLVMTSSGKTLDQVISTLKQLAPTMPCT